MSWNMSKGGFNVGLGNSRVSINTRDGGLGVKISDHLSIDLKNGGLNFTI